MGNRAALTAVLGPAVGLGGTEPPWPTLTPAANFVAGLTDELREYVKVQDPG